MTEQEQIRAIAELANDHDAIVIQPDGSVNFVLEGAVVGHMDNPLKSRDVIVPVIEKQHPAALEQFSRELLPILWRHWEALGKRIDWNITSNLVGASIQATPRQLTEALLRATGKWK